MNLTLFDLDGTLLPIDSDHAFGQFMVDIGWADREQFGQRNEEFFQQYQRGQLDVPAYIDFATSAWRHRPLDEALAGRERFMQDVLRKHIHGSARALVGQHQAAGDWVVMATATNEFVTTPIAAEFGIAHLIAVELERDANGRVTGGIKGVPSLGAGKLLRVQNWLAQQGQMLADFEHVTFYSDSTNDLPLLEQATEPVATNPSPALERIAIERGWRVLRLFE